MKVVMECKGGILICVLKPLMFVFENFYFLYVYFFFNLYLVKESKL